MMYWTLRLCAVAITAMLAINAPAQQHTPGSSAAIYAQLKRLQSLTSVLYVAAHPDDENTRLLSWLATGRYVRTAYLSITRGDGGQNILGPEQGAALGLIRSHELLAARRLDGAEQYFARAVDFGFSKSAQETFRHWDEVQLIADIVRIIRHVRPDVIICRFPKDSLAGHGQHAASAILTEKAFDYCRGDLRLSPQNQKRLEDLLKGTQPWSPARLLFNAFRFGNRSTVTDDMFRLEVGNYDPLLGMGYGELAGISRSIHRSQGAGTPSTPGTAPEYFAVLRGSPLSTSLFDGIDTSWTRVQRPDIVTAVQTIINAYSFTQPYRSLPALLELRRNILSVEDLYWRDQKLAEVNKAIISCMGITADATVAESMVVPGSALKSRLRFIQRSHQNITVQSVQWLNRPPRSAVRA